MTATEALEAAEAFLRGFTGRGTGWAGRAVAARLLALPRRRPLWGVTAPRDRYDHFITGLVELWVTEPAVLTARGDLVACAVLLAVELYDRVPGGSCPEELRALAALIASAGLAELTPP